MQPCGRCGGNNVEAHHVRSEHFGGIRCEATRGMVHDSGTPFSRAASGATVLRGMRVTETLVSVLLHYRFAPTGRPLHNCLQVTAILRE